MEIDDGLKQYISYDTAVLAKKKGITVNGLTPLAVDLTQSELQRILRTKYKIDVCVYPVELVINDKTVEQEEYEYTYWIFVKGKKHYPLSTQVHEGFEITFEHALERALNIIP